MYKVKTSHLAISSCYAYGLPNLSFSLLDCCTCSIQLGSVGETDESPDETRLDMSNDNNAFEGKITCFAFLCINGIRVGKWW